MVDAHRNHGSQIKVEVSYALPEWTFLRQLTVPLGTTLQEAIMQSGVLQAVVGLDLSQCQLGIYSKIKSPDTVLREQDRVEIYRPLIADPKESRRRRAEKKKAQS